MEENLIVAVDLGSSNMKGVIGYRNEEGKLSIKAVHTRKSSGVKKGMIVDSSALRESFFPFMRELLNKAGLANVRVKKFYVFNSYRKMKSVPVDIEKYFEEQVIEQELLDSMKKESLNNPTSNSYVNMESILQAYMINDAVTLSPLGKTASYIKGRYTVLIGNEDGITNLYKSLGVSNKDVAEYSCSHFVSFESLGEVSLTKKERVKGTLLIDFGGETTTVAYYSQLSLRHLNVFDFGGVDITNRLKEEFSISQSDAEKIKIKCGVKPREGKFAISVDGEKNVVELSAISECINKAFDAQISEIELFCQKNNILSKCTKIAILGGGAKCAGLTEKLESVFEKEVVKAFPVCIGEDLSKVSSKDCLKYLDYSKLYAVLNTFDENCLEEEVVEQTPSNKKNKSRRDSFLNYFDSIIDFTWGDSKEKI